MGSASVVRMEREEALQEREALLSELDLPLEELRARASEYTLSHQDFIKWRRIEDLTWLLGE